MGRATRAAGLVLAIALGASAWVMAAPAAPAAVGAPAQSEPAQDCDWPQWGQAVQRDFSYPCETELSVDRAADLQPIWFFNSRDTVTATPAVVGSTLYVGDWSGNFYALNTKTGKPRWRYKAPLHGQVYAGQIVSSAAVAEVDGVETVYFASGKTMFALRTKDGKVRWRYEIGRPGDDDDPSEIESSPLVVDGMVVFGSDVHNSLDGEPAGVYALDAATGKERWQTITAPTDGDGATGSGCGDVWGSATADLESRTVFVGTGNCNTSPEGWGRFAEALLALDLDTGDVRWTYQPHPPNNDDLDFAGAPNLFEANGRKLVGLGNKDAVYYAVDRATGELVWKTQVTEPGIEGPNYSTGGFIGATAVDDGLIVGGTAIGGPCPCMHALHSNTGKIAWQQSEAAPTFATSALVNGVAFSGSTTDFTLRALDASTGKVLWSQQLVGGIAGGVAVSGDLVVAVAGIREPGIEAAGTDSGVYGFTLGPPGTTATTAAPQGTLPPTTVAPPPTAPDPNAPSGDRCLGVPCSLPFDLKAPPPGTTPSMTILIRPQPFRIEVRADDLGDPDAWLRPGSPTATKGAVTYGVFGSDDALKGALLCVLDADFDCVSDVAPADPTRLYNRISILAIANTPELPAASEGFDRLVTTVALEHPLSFK